MNSVALVPAPTAAVQPSPAPAENLGPFAAAVESAPVPSLTGVGLVLGGLLGALTAWSLSSLVKSENIEAWTLVGAAIGGVTLGAEGYARGQELSQWLQDHK